MKIIKIFLFLVFISLKQDVISGIDTATINGWNFISSSSEVTDYHSSVSNESFHGNFSHNLLITSRKNGIIILGKNLGKTFLGVGNYKCVCKTKSLGGGSQSYIEINIYGKKDGITWSKIIGMGINATGMNVWTPYLYTPGLVGEFEEAKMEILFLAGPAEPITMNLLIDYLHSLDEFFNFKETIDDFGDPITGIVSQSGTQTPNVYALSQNYPNPFNPVTKIDFSIPKSGLVTLKVFDILGKEIATLVNEKLSAGKYETDFNASKLSSGTYYYRIETGDYVETKKMLLIK